MFGFTVPTELPGVDTNILDPRNTYANPEEWSKKAEMLAEKFINNFKKFENNEAGKARCSRSRALIRIPVQFKR